jgi:acetyltransferase
MQPNPLKTLMNPQSIVFLGGSNSLQTVGTAQLLNIVKGGYKGKVYPVHLKEKTVIGLKSYQNISSLPEPADLAVMVIPNPAIPGILEECGKKGIRHAIIITAGYEEMGHKGGQMQKALIHTCKQHGIRFLGPNCIGIINDHINLNTTWFPLKYKQGKVGIISQSGSYVTQTLPYFEKLGLGISQAISVGNQADIDMVDCLEYLSQDPGTEAIALYIEGLKRPSAFLELAKQITPHKPIVALYVGGTEAGSRACASHTASISGPDEIYGALFRQAGILRAKNFSDLFDWSLALAQQPLPSGNNMAILSNSGGPGTSMADECNRHGLYVPMFNKTTQEKIRAMTPLTASPKNPVDITMNYDLDLIFKKLPCLILDMPDIDGMLFYGIFGPMHFQDKKVLSEDLIDIPIDLMKKLMRDACARFVEFPDKNRKPILCACFCGREDEAVMLIQDGGIPVYPTPGRAVRAMGALWKYKKIRDGMEQN